MSRWSVMVVLVVALTGCRGKRVSTLEPSTFTDRLTDPPTVTIVPTIDLALISNATLGVTAMAHVPKVVDARVRLGYGLGVPNGPWFEAYAGYSISWSGISKMRWQTRRDGDTAYFIHAKLPVRRVLTLEGGIEASKLGFELLDASGSVVGDDVNYLMFPRAGLRLASYYRVTSSYGSARGYWSMWLHAVFPTLSGIPDAPVGGRVLFQTSFSGKHEGEIETALPVGAAFGVEVPLFANTPWASLRLEFVVHPGPDKGHVGFAALLFPISL